MRTRCRNGLRIVVMDIHAVAMIVMTVVVGEDLVGIIRVDRMVVVTGIETGVGVRADAKRQKDSSKVLEKFWMRN